MTSMLKVLKPTAITDAMFVSSSIAADPTTWLVGTSYALAATVVYNHRNYESLVATNQGNIPDAIATTKWLDKGPSNRWAMFDSVNSTASTATNAVTTPMTSRVAPGICNGVTVLGITNAASVKVEQYNGATLVWTGTQLLDGTVIGDWYQYFFEPYKVSTELLFGPLLPYPSSQVLMTITGTNNAVTVGCGSFMCGNTVELGQVMGGPTVGILDYSVKQTDAFGITTLVKRNYAKRVTFGVKLDNADLRRVFSTLADLRATPAVWIGSDQYKLSPLVVYGPYKDFSINVAYADFSVCSLEIEGLT